MTKNNRTSKEHYIPQVYLNGFASEEKRLYFYDLNSRSYSDQMVPVKSICYSKDLYEYKNEYNQIVFANVIEKALGSVESSFAKNRDAIHSKIRVVNNQTNCFLSESEKNYWAFYITVQLFRLPKIIEESTKALQEMTPSSEEYYRIRNTALSFMLPFLNGIKPENLESSLFVDFFAVILSFKCTVVYDSQHRLITSDNPLYFHSSTESFYSCDELFFPIDSSLCLIMAKNGFYPENGMITLNSNLYEELFKSIVYVANDKLFTGRKFTKQEKYWLRDVLSDRIKDGIG